MDGKQFKNAKHLWFILALVLGACTAKNDRVSADDEERPVDWSAHIELTLHPDTVLQDRDVMWVNDFQSSQPIESLVEQLYSMAFSGEASIHPINLFGEMDEEELTPEALVGKLKRFDTVLVEDIYSGEMKDTVIDNSFSLEKTSALLLQWTWNQAFDHAAVYSSAFGIQVFDPVSGARRGDSKRFYLQFKEDRSPSLDHLKIYSDSLGFFHPVCFEVYPQETQTSLKEYCSQQFGARSCAKLSFDLSLVFKTGEMKLNNVSLQPASLKDPI